MPRRARARKRGFLGKGGYQARMAAPEIGDQLMSPQSRSTTAEQVELRSIADRVQIAPGVMKPRLGLGTWKAHGETLQETILAAFEMGYRHLDTSANYYNEEEVGEAIARSGLAREDIFVTTKLETPDQGYMTTAPAFEASLKRLGLSYIDMYLIHQPHPAKTQDTWRALEEIVNVGLVQAIGVSNFEPEHMDAIYEVATIPPAVNQIELHPLKQQRAVQEYCREHGIVIEAWAPVMRGRAGQVPELASIASKHSKTAEQVCLRWILQKGMTAIPKTVHEERLRENADIFDFELTAEEIDVIDGLDVDYHAVY